jgi:hypothetical protein
VTNKTAAVMEERINLNLTTKVSAFGPSLVEATKNCLADQAWSFDGVRRFEIIAARRISTSFMVPIGSLEGEAWELWEFEVFVHTR